MGTLHHQPGWIVFETPNDQKWPTFGIFWSMINNCSCKVRFVWSLRTSWFVGWFTTCFLPRLSNVFGPGDQTVQCIGGKANYLERLVGPMCLQEMVLHRPSQRLFRNPFYRDRVKVNHYVFQRVSGCFWHFGLFYPVNHLICYFTWLSHLL
jgi:hypothetical protein